MSNTPMEHKDLEQLLPDYAAGTLDQADSELLSAHLSQCDECGERLQAFRQVMQELQSAKGADDVPAGYFANLLPRFRARLEKRSGSLFSAGWFRLVSPVAAAIVVVGLLATLRLSPDAGEPNGLRALAAELETTEFTDAFLSEIDQQMLSSMTATDAFAGTLAREAVSRELLERMAESPDLAPLQSFDDLENDELDVLLQRLQSRKYL
ncbi:MAG: zf-HC2 domain-containing protein [Bacteroidota bacterium]